MTCKDCLHYDACSMMYERAKNRKVPELNDGAEKVCEHFKDKNRYVEVVRCPECRLHNNCHVEDMFKFAGIYDGYCCAGKRRTK